MNRQKIIYIIGIVIVVGAIAYLFSSAFQSALEYYVTVAELQAQDQPSTRRLKVAGFVKKDSLSQTGQAPVTYQFTLEQGGHELAVRYAGLVPDTFHEGGEVVATGYITSGGVFQADHILAKCASKYTAAE